jgi:hypothetical protein
MSAGGPRRSAQRVQPEFPEAAAHVAHEKAVTAFDLDEAVAPP